MDNENKILLRYKILISISELIGFIVFLIPTILVIFRGGVIEDTFTDIAFDTLLLALFLREIHFAFLVVFVGLIIGITFILSYTVLKISKAKNFALAGNKWIFYRISLGIYIGWILGEILFYFALNGIFFRNVFVSIPFFWGSMLFFGVLGLIFGDLTFSPGIIRIATNQNKSNVNAISILKWIESSTKIILLLIISLLLIIPNIYPLLGVLPTPPNNLDEPYLTSSNYFDYKVIKIEHNLPNEISSMVVKETASGKWYTYIYVPKVGSSENLNFPVGFYLHGYTGIDVILYHSSLVSLARRGVIAIFAQYATNIDYNEQIEFTHPSENPEIYVRYVMEWSGINQAISALNLETPNLSSQELSTYLGNNYTIDYSRLMIIGHSMGGGMVPYITTKSLEMGWGSNELILDMEAPWYMSNWVSTQANFSLYPQHSLINIATYEDDHSVSQCIGMDIFEKVRITNGTSLPDSQLKYIYIKSDFHGFPRLLASHYLPIDPLDDPLHQFGYKKRINAMAYYLFQSTQQSDVVLEMVKQYFLGTEVVDMGKWSDGVAVEKAIVTNDPYGIRGSANIVSQIQDITDETCII